MSAFLKNELAALASQSENATKDIAKGDVLYRLLKNKDFKIIFMEGMCGTYILDQVSMLASPLMQSPEQQALLKQSLLGVSAFQQYIKSIKLNSKTAKCILETEEETRADILAID